jgi:hypothetical protein
MARPSLLSDERRERIERRRQHGIIRKLSAELRSKLEEG